MWLAHFGTPIGRQIRQAANLQVARADNPTEPLQPLALRKQPAVKALKVCP